MTNNTTIHLTDGMGRAVCNSFLHEPRTADWENREEVNCVGCLAQLHIADTKYLQMRTIARKITDIQKKYNDTSFEYEKTDLERQKKNLLREEGKYHPTSGNEAYLMAQIASDIEFAKKEEK